MLKRNKVSPINKKTLTVYNGLIGIGTLFFSIALNVYLETTVTGSFFLLVNGHPIPIAFEPKPNQTIDGTDELPEKVTIYFTDRPEIKASSIHVMDFKNKRVDNNDLKLDSDKMLSISLDKSKMTFGVYSISWLILSKDNGFITKGSYFFSIENDRILEKH